MKIKLKTVTFQIADGATTRAPASSPGAAVPILRAIFADLDVDREHFVVLALNSKNRPVGFKVVATGTMTSAPIDRRCLLRDALAFGAASIIVAHNHPSGDPDPSPDDLALTEGVKAGCQAVGLTLLDHVILVTDGRWISFQQRGLL